MAEERKLQVSDTEESPPEGVATPGEKLARRKLLKMAYVVPAVIGTVLISQDAMAQQASCQPFRNPCRPPPPCKPRPPQNTAARRR